MSVRTRNIRPRACASAFELARASSPPRPPTRELYLWRTCRELKTSHRVSTSCNLDRVASRSASRRSSPDTLRSRATLASRLDVNPQSRWPSDIVTPTRAPPKICSRSAARPTFIFCSVLLRSEASFTHRPGSGKKTNASCCGRAEAPGDTVQVGLVHTLSFPSSRFDVTSGRNSPPAPPRPDPHGDVERQVSSNESELRAAARGLTLDELHTKTV